MGYVRPDRRELVVRQASCQFGRDNPISFNTHLRAATEIRRCAVITNKMEVINGRRAKFLERFPEIGFAALELLRFSNDQRI